MVNIRMDERLKKAMEALAEKQHTSMSSLVRIAMIKLLEENGIDWTEE